MNRNVNPTIPKSNKLSLPQAIILITAMGGTDFKLAEP